MFTYAWSGINNNAEKISGISQANNKLQLKNSLIKKNIVPIKIYLKISFKFWNHTKITPNSITHLIEQLSLLINSNIPIAKAFKIAAQDTQNSKLKTLILNCEKSISSGNSLHQTLQQYPNCFNKLICGLINVGEQSGTLDLILIELASHLKKIALQKRKLIKAMIYPAAVLFTTTAVTIIFLVFMIPQFETMFNNFGAKLPTYTQLIIGFSKLLQKTWRIILSIIVLITISTKIIFKRSEKFRELLDNLILNVPLIKTILIYSTIARLTKTLSLTLKSGIPLTLAINISVTTISNRRFKTAMQNSIKLIANGKSFNEALKAQNIFPNKVTQLISLGEESGKLEPILQKISDIYSEQLNTITENLNEILEPAIMLILSIVVGSLIIGMYLPIFQLGEVI